MAQANWTQPVQLKFAAQGPQQIRGPFDALILLMDNWPDLRGPRYVAARSLCRAAIAGRVPAEQARQVFIEAAREAKLPLN